MGLIPQTVETVDIMPTIFNYAGILDPFETQGNSLAEYLVPFSHDDSIAFSELNFYGRNYKSLLIGNHKLVLQKFNSSINADSKDELFIDLDTNPEENVNLKLTQQDDLKMFFKARIKIINENSTRLRKRLIGEEPQKSILMDDRTKQRLRMLGYIN
ncbi:MAG: hypothetical protein A2161_22285 [Candidatus Schekmanbacteria bacterium RBG_13_48_7]|uniref:Uncharacterized protein n=1 Tax=Candidatus Schekmanbacteria bacterium RBG_13_48_7 TaxID=1817878 RepID=A0A1F7RYC0_9BACT|nr:MAG: hypothetical protein A2161_22285 [Candidatus Schekmanbacteria bacterium RBG_13_48_7]